MTFEFSASSRIRESKDFEQAFRLKAVTNKWFSIHLSKNIYNHARLGMVVSKRVMSRSVSRNIAKRMIREVFRHHSAVLPANDYVVRIRRTLSKESSKEASAALLALILSTKSND